MTLSGVVVLKKATDLVGGFLLNIIQRPIFRNIQIESIFSKQGNFNRSDFHAPLLKIINFGIKRTRIIETGSR